MGQKRRCWEIFSCHDTILESASIDLTHPDTLIFNHMSFLACFVRIHIRTDDSVYIYICMKCKQRFLLTNLISSCFLEMTMQTMKVLRFPLIGLCIFIDSGSHGMLNKMKEKNNCEKRFMHKMVVLMPIFTSTYKILNSIQWIHLHVFILFALLAICWSNMLIRKEKLITWCGYIRRRWTFFVERKQMNCGFVVILLILLVLTWYSWFAWYFCFNLG